MRHGCSAQIVKVGLMQNVQILTILTITSVITVCQTASKETSLVLLFEKICIFNKIKLYKKCIDSHTPLY